MDGDTIIKRESNPALKRFLLKNRQRLVVFKASGLRNGSVNLTFPDTVSLEAKNVSTRGEHYLT